MTTKIHPLFTFLVVQLTLLPSSFFCNAIYIWNATTSSRFRCTNTTTTGLKFTYDYTMQGPELVGSWLEGHVNFGDGSENKTFTSKSFDRNNPGIRHTNNIKIIHMYTQVGTYHPFYHLRRGGFFNDTPDEMTLTLTVDSVLLNPVIITESSCEVGAIDNDDENDDPNNDDHGDNDDNEATSIKQVTNIVWFLVAAGLYFLV